MLNKVMIIGRLGRDPELRYSQSGSPVCTLNIATDESYTDRDGNRVDRAEWHRVVVFQKAAENCSQYLTKITKIWARRFLPRPAAWTTCRSRKILGRERVTGWRPFSSPNLPARLAPSLSPPKTFDWWGGRAEGVRSDVRLGETGFPCLTQR